jgi:uncharacterized protein (DUF1330 family)
MMLVITTHELTVGAPPKSANSRLGNAIWATLFAWHLSFRIGAGAAVVRSSHAYWVARSKITDPVAYKKYTDRVLGIIAKFGGKALARGGHFRIQEGPQKFHRFVVIEFPSLEQAVACHQSPEICGGLCVP